MTQCFTDTIRQCSDCIVENQKILRLIALECLDELFENLAQEWNQLFAGFFFQRGECRARGFLYFLVAVQGASEELKMEKFEVF